MVKSLSFEIIVLRDLAFKMKNLIDSSLELKPKKKGVLLSILSLLNGILLLLLYLPIKFPSNYFKELQASTGATEDIFIVAIITFTFTGAALSFLSFRYNEKLKMIRILGALINISFIIFIISAIVFALVFINTHKSLF